MNETHSKAFRPRARLMLLLGDQLIRDAGIALVELVKNAYDADATECAVVLEHIDEDDPEARIVIEDNGEGMNLQTVLDVWLEPATEHRKEQRSRGLRTRRLQRLPLGEKGVGRFAVHKLGRRVRLISRRGRRREVVVDIDWGEFDRARHLDEVMIDVTERRAEVFRGRRSGTRIEISDLRNRPWTRSRVQSAHRAISSIRSPFGGPDGFDPSLTLVPESDWLAGMLEPQDILAEAIYLFRGSVDNDELSYTYEFRPRGRMSGVEGRRIERRRLPLYLALPDAATGRAVRRRIHTSQLGIGTIEIELSIFDRDPKVLRLTSSDPLGVGRLLDRSGGVRVYRDGVRVYDYGEPGNDWLELGARRAKVPARRISNNQVIGAVHLDRSSSDELIEKTNREGFVENEAMEAFRHATLFAVAQAEAERSVDRTRIRQTTGAATRKPLFEDLEQLRAEIERLDLTAALGPAIDRVEEKYRDAVERLLAAAGAGLNVAAVLHEVERGTRYIEQSLSRGDDRDIVIQSARDLAATVDGLTWLTRRSGEAEIEVKTLTRQALFNSAYRFRAHGIDASDGFLTGDPQFMVRCSRRLIVGAIMNLIDNSIYWLLNRGAKDKRIHVGATYEPDGVPTIVVADNGPGVLDPASALVEPFFTRKANGMGLGLHIVDEIMKSHRGRLRFAGVGEVNLPPGLDGAVVLLQFPERDASP